MQGCQKENKYKRPLVEASRLVEVFNLWSQTCDPDVNSQKYEVIPSICSINFSSIFCERVSETSETSHYYCLHVISTDV